MFAEAPRAVGVRSGDGAHQNGLSNTVEGQHRKDGTSGGSAARPELHPQGIGLIGSNRATRMDGAGAARCQRDNDQRAAEFISSPHFPIRSLQPIPFHPAQGSLPNLYLLQPPTPITSPTPPHSITLQSTSLLPVPTRPDQPVLTLTRPRLIQGNQPLASTRCTSGDTPRGQERATHGAAAVSANADSPPAIQLSRNSNV